MTMTLFRRSLTFCLLVLLSLNATTTHSLSLEDNDEHLVEELSRYFSLDLMQKVFQGEIFSQATNAWQISSNYGFEQLLSALAKQNILNQYLSVGNLIIFSGEYKNNSVLLHLERLSDEAYQGYLSVMSLNSQEFSHENAKQLNEYLLREGTHLALKKATWLPASALLLMDIKNNPQVSQRIYLDPMDLESFKTMVSSNLINAGWTKKTRDEMGLSVWNKGSQQLQLHFSQHTEGTALYIQNHEF